MSILERVNSPADLQQLNENDLPVLAQEIRTELIDTVSKTGGHLASNLGVVELTIALHRSFSLPKDKIVWDVGHQSYVHKMLTGRRSKMSTIRQKGGLCGFSSPEESPYDAFATGHSSTSVSAALGLAKARDLAGGDEHIVAVIGDGALTGGLAFEALNQIAHEEERIIIILNDNAMSISENVGGLSKYLTRLRTSSKYLRRKQTAKTKLGKSRFGTAVLNKLSHMKDIVKYAVSPGMMFEEWGFTFLGPVDGHDIGAISRMLERAKGMDEPVILHVSTKKGKGYSFAEENPEKFHGIDPFDVATGQVKTQKAPTFSSAFGQALVSLAKGNDKVAAVTPSMASGSGLLPFAQTFPDRFFDVGIAEAHAVTFSSALAEGGLVPVCSVYSSFLQRAYDSLIHDCAMTGKHVVFAIDRAGAVPGDGKSHQGVFDLAFLSHIPNMAVLSPLSFSEQEKMLRYAVNEHQGPIAIRYPKGAEPASYDCGEFSFGKAVSLREGKDAVILAEGATADTAMQTAEMLSKEGIEVGVVYLRTVKPFDKAAVRRAAENVKLVITLENGVKAGGIGEQIAAYVAEEGIHTPIMICAFPDEFLPHATVPELMDMYGLSPEKLAVSIKEKLS